MKKMTYSASLSIFEINPNDYPEVDRKSPKGTLLKKIIKEADQSSSAAAEKSKS